VRQISFLCRSLVEPVVTLSVTGPLCGELGTVPGVDVATIDITLDKGVLSVSGERARATDDKAVERTRSERPYGRFHRRFTLPDTVDAANVQATGRNGIVEVTIPKQPKAQPRRIQVASA
jgi:HSP20 family protein